MEWTDRISRFIDVIKANDHRKIEKYVKKYEDVKRFLPESLPYCIYDPRVELATIDLLIKLGADPHIKNYDHQNYNMVNYLCGDEGRIDAIKHLVLKYGVNVNDRSSMGYTPLHNAITGGWLDDERIDVVKFLLDNGANPLAEDNEGMTPRQWLLYIRNDEFYREHFDYSTYDEIEHEKKVDRIIADMLKQREKEILSLLLLRNNMLEKSRQRMYDPRVWRMVLNYAQSKKKLSPPSFSEEKDD